MYCCLETPIGVGIFSKGTVKRIEIYTKNSLKKKNMNQFAKEKIGDLAPEIILIFR